MSYRIVSIDTFLQNGIAKSLCHGLSTRYRIEQTYEKVDDNSRSKAATYVHAHFIFCF